ncbi:Transcriptional regulator, TetR family [Tepidanaerobacter acetatoxydans Re1]|uniref:Transcriptional regulator, TetR family n=1 Tax=Tepidanaerobacter acetatoxydans (strain DSM 21804 / JCM 16047 / Re1) TaxID=1209989 RepID=F4LW68_TEPAE|nr:TetR/AcrR family transcriptional regulator [Tepidanaerobacter acetatoxydans]AEE90844.1 transcriptional regulator, TetR family [Tepidanaerobacter acetatoxydans Re1]CCP25407.1 Transcriptional regulator, TetR family [Tepidanaerobacter acetatoxydans Re1]
MNKRDAIETKARILSAAEDIFSKVGFDGARVDDIAKEAGVNKALIYYYFKSKNEILETLFSSLIEDARRMLVKSMEGTPDVSGNDGYRKLFDIYIRFVSQKRKIIKVAVAESAKTNVSSSIIMELGNLIINAEIDALRKEYEKKGLHFPEDKQELLVMEFFTGLTPFLSYALYKDQWEDQYGMSEEVLQNYFYQAFKKAHLEAHLRW